MWSIGTSMRGRSLMATNDSDPMNSAPTCNHFSQCNPEGARQASIPDLLRRVADTISALGPIQLLDVSYSELHNEYGYWPQISV